MGRDRRHLLLLQHAALQLRPRHQPRPRQPPQLRPRHNAGTQTDLVAILPIHSEISRVLSTKEKERHHHSLAAQHIVMFSSIRHEFYTR